MFYEHSSYNIWLTEKLYLYVIKKSIVLPKEKTNVLKIKIHVF